MSGQPVNGTCPWSGEPVSVESITRYRGHDVAFCNPGCCDKFATAITHFDAAIAECEAPFAPSIGGQIYRPRTYTSAGLRSAGRARFKSYVIDLHGARWNFDAAVSAAEDHVSHIAAKEGLGEGNLGYLILHRGEEAVWLLVHWWDRGGILMGHLARSHDGQTFAPANRQLIACVWELRVIEYEAAAWKRHMMQAQPDAEAYRADFLPDGDY